LIVSIFVGSVGDLIVVDGYGDICSDEDVEYSYCSPAISTHVNSVGEIVYTLNYSKTGAVPTEEDWVDAEEALIAAGRTTYKKDPFPIIFAILGVVGVLGLMIILLNRVKRRS
jgi:hypothetical protein